MGRVTNTTECVRRRPADSLAMASIVGAGKFIENQEAEGQREFVHSDVIPRKGVDDAALLAIGFQLGDRIGDDPLFRPATLPAGWKRRPSDHSMWSYIDDEQGRQRASIFYKAAYYDRDADMSLAPRFRIDSPYFEGADRWACVQHKVLDCGNVVFESAILRHANPTHCNINTAGSDANHRAYWDENESFHKQAQAECVAWLTENGFPDYTNPVLYW